MRAALLEYAEEPGLWIPLAPPSEVIEADGYAVVTSLYSPRSSGCGSSRHRSSARSSEMRAIGARAAAGAT